MSVAEITARIDQIRGNLGLATVAATRTSGSAFASTLSSTLSGSSPLTATGPVDGFDVVDSARKYLGVPYVFGGTDPAKGLDCSALVQRAYADLGIELPRIAADQAREGTAVPSMAQARPGDLLAFNSPVDHIAIYIGDGKMIAAPRPGDQVKIQSVYETPTAIRRVLPGTTAPISTIPAMRPASLSGTVPFSDLFTSAGAKYGISPNLLAAVAKVESGYNPGAVSKAGAQGLMQIMPATARGLGVDATNPAQAVDGAARLLKQHLTEFNGSLPLALAAYNAGGGAVHKYGGIPPYAETQAYVPKVQAAMADIARKGFAA